MATKPAAMKPVKTPQDHKPPASRPDRDVTFTFVWDGQEYESTSIADALTPGWLRQNRRRDLADFLYTLLEIIYPEDHPIWAVVDGDWDATDALLTQLNTFNETHSKVGANLGE